MATMRWTSLLVCLGLALAGCRKATQESLENAVEKQMAEQGQIADVQIGDENFSMQIQAADGRSQFQAGRGTNVPDGFPQDVPLYPDQAIIVGHSQAENAVFMIQATTADSVEAVAEFYVKSAAENGWQETSNTAQTNQLRMLAFEKGERQFQVAITRNGQGTTLNLSTMQK